MRKRLSDMESESTSSEIDDSGFSGDSDARPYSGDLMSLRPVIPIFGIGL
ncbi:unnamed protein product [Wuchereria bancrofti]|uniref:Uncharacterized protein n=1 Tax=Wuchereria bancrofti TaxID=6293 RepID=A0A3P7DHM5_WUCBA|nr:unnamed protein product [Wuchereria bancrofti]